MLADLPWDGCPGSGKYLEWKQLKLFITNLSLFHSFRCITDCKSYPDECIRWVAKASFEYLKLFKSFTAPYSEELFRRHADLIASEGYADAGYEYVIIDDCWLESKRDSITNKLVADRQRFPRGLNVLADHVRLLRFSERASLMSHWYRSTTED